MSQMKVLSISTDRRLFESGSAVRERTLKYGDLFTELHIVVFAPASDYQKEQLASNIWLYPTKSKNRWHYVFDAYRIAKKLIKNHLSDDSVITTQDPFETGLVGYWLTRKFKLPLQIQVHTDFLSPYFRQENWLNRVRLAISRLTLPSTKNVRVVSERIKNSLISGLKINHQKIDVLPITLDKGFDLSAKPASKVFSFSLLVASRLTKEKDIATALRALKQVIASYPHVGLVVVGEGPERSRLEQLVVDLQLDKSVKFIGWQNKLSPYYKSADVFILTSLYEGFGMTLAEAAANNCAIVTTDVGLVGSVLRADKEVLVCPIKDGNCLAEKVVKLIEDPDLRFEMSQRAKARLEQSVLAEDKYLERYKLSLEKTIKPGFAD